LDKADIDQRNRLLQKVAEGYAQKQQLERALSIVQQIDNFGNSPYKVQTLALVATASKTAQTDKLLNQATTEARKLEPQQRAFALASIAQAFLKIGNQLQAKKLLDETIQAVQTEKSFSVRENNLQIISDSLIAAKQYNAALQIVKAIPTTARDYKLPVLAKLVIDSGEEATEIVNILNKNTKIPENKTRGLTTIAETYLRAQKLESAKQVLDLAFVAAKTIPNPESRVLTFGNPPDVTVVDDDGDRASSLERIALLKTKAGDYNQAAIVAQAIQDKKLREQLMQQLLCYKR
jgi:tetratricopeptide (TPR) repeat protein